MAGGEAPRLKPLEPRLSTPALACKNRRRPSTKLSRDELHADALRLGRSPHRVAGGVLRLLTKFRQRPCVSVSISGFATLARHTRSWQHRNRDGRSVSCGVGWMFTDQPGKHPRWPSAPASDARARGRRTSLCSADLCPAFRLHVLAVVSCEILSIQEPSRIATCLMRPRGIASAIPVPCVRKRPMHDVQTAGAMRSPAGADGWWPANAAIPRLAGRRVDQGHRRIKATGRASVDRAERKRTKPEEPS